MQTPLIIVCDWIPPAFGAVGQYEMARARGAAYTGRHVTLIGLGGYETRETVVLGAGTLAVIRIAAAPPDKDNLFKRAIWTFNNSGALLRAAARTAKTFPSCEIRVTGSPPFLSYLILLWRGLNRRRKITYRITDFYPEAAFAAGRALSLRPLTPLIHALRRRADRIEVLSECQRRRLQESGVPPARIEVIRDVSPVRFGASTVPAKRPFAADDIVLLYSGNLGVAHDWSTFAEGYRRHVRNGPNRVRLWLNARGVGAPGLRSFCERHRLPVHISDPVPLDQLASVLKAADAHLILLAEPFLGYVFPSKIYGCMESGRPCVYVGPAASDAHSLLLANGKHHFSVRNGDVDGVETALAEIASSVERNVDATV